MYASLAAANPTITGDEDTSDSWQSDDASFIDEESDNDMPNETIRLDNIHDFLREKHLTSDYDSSDSEYHPNI
jgi:hypothetical protein